MFRTRQVVAVIVATIWLGQPIPVAAQTPDSASLAAAVVEEAAKWRYMVGPRPPASSTPWETMLMREFRRADLRPPSDTSAMWWMRLGYSELSFTADTAIVEVDLVVCWKGEGLRTLGNNYSRYRYLPADNGWQLLSEEPGPMGSGICMPEGPGLPLRLAPADSVSLATAVARALSEGQLPVRAAPPQAPDAWEALLAQQLESLGLPEPHPPVQWVHLRASRAYEDEGRTLVTVTDRGCLGHGDPMLVGHVVEYEFAHADGVWRHVDTQMKLSGSGSSCRASGPEPTPDP